VYGTFNGRISEKTQVNPLSDYAIAHYAAEQIVKRFSVSSHLKSLLLRPNAVFGIPVSMEAFDRWFLIPYAFPLEAVYNERITLRTSGEQRRNFLSVDDLSLYVEKFLESEGSDDSLTIINPIGPETLSVYQFALRCAEIYTELTGQGCIVSRPAPAETDVGSDFVYDSMHVCFWTGSRLDNYLHSFTQRLVEDKKQGRRYGTVDDPR
jgi:UDP-glucose 4-epimerase